MSPRTRMIVGPSSLTSTPQLIEHRMQAVWCQSSLMRLSSSNELARVKRAAGELRGPLAECEIQGAVVVGGQCSEVGTDGVPVAAGGGAGESGRGFVEDIEPGGWAGAGDQGGRDAG